MKSLRTGVIVTCIGLLITFVIARAQTNTDPVVQFNSSLNLETKGDNTGALNAMSPLVRAADADYLISMRFGWLNYLTGHYATSQKYYEQADRLGNQKSIEALLGLTLPLAAQNNWTEVERQYNRILAIDPLHYTANLRMGQMKLNQGDFTAADRYLSAARTYYPADYEANLLSGWNAFNLGLRDHAKLFFTRALMLSPNDTSATRGLNMLK